MNEDEVRSALRNVMVASSPPPPMDTGTAVEVGQKAHRRRRATRAGVVAGLAVVGIAVGATFLPTALTGGGLLDAASGDGPVNGSTETPWPNGQTDRTATKGPRADKSADLVPDLAKALPSGLAVGEKRPSVVLSTQSQFTDYAADGGEVWEYQATAPVTKTDGSERVGTLFAQVTTAGNPIPADPCAAAAQAWGIKGACRVVDAGGKQVGLLTSDGTGTEKVFDQLAAYRHPDGTVVLVAQATTFRDSGLPALDAQPLTEDQLAALATDPEFHLD
jgi:hypothetical protein